MREVTIHTFNAMVYIHSLSKIYIFQNEIQFSFCRTFYKFIALYSEALTAVSVLSAESLFLQPHGVHDKASAAQAHKAFALRDGDLPSMVGLYNSWLKVLIENDKYLK
jgi:hypothetical protein